MSAPAIEARALTVRRGGQAVIADISLAMDAGETLSLVGPNGSGKTTLMLALLGLIEVQGGSVEWNGRDVRSLPARARARLAGYVPQQLECIPPLHVWDVVAGGRYSHVGALEAHTAEDRGAIERALEQCGLAALADRPLDTLSGGERQKALLAAAIAQDPQVLCLDEPNTGLDPAYQLELVRILREWQRAGRALLVVSHDLQLPAALGGRVVALRAGRVVAAGPAPELLEPSVLEGVYGARFGTVTSPAGTEIVLPQWWR